MKLPLQGCDQTGGEGTRFRNWLHSGETVSWAWDCMACLLSAGWRTHVTRATRGGFSSSLTMENLNAKLGTEILFTRSPQNGHSGLCQGCRFVFECHMAAGVNSYLPEYVVLNTLQRLQLHTAQSAWLGLHLLFTHFIPQLPRLFGCN